MKKYSILSVIPLLAMLAGCASVSTPSIGPALTEAAIQAGASYEMSSNPQAAPYIAIAAPIICSLAGQGTVDPAAIVAALDASPSAQAVKSPIGTLVLNAALGLYQLVYNSYGTNITSSVMGPYLTAMCDGLTAAALPNPTPPSPAVAAALARNRAKVKSASIQAGTKWVFVK
jgi:hypothetical protein